jgi:hypothetical protein
MRKNEADIWIFRQGSVPQEAVDGARGVDVVLDDAGLSGEIAAAGSARGVDKHHGATAIQFRVDGREGRIAEPLVHVARPQGDAVSLQHVQGVGDFLQAAVGIGQGQRREIAEAAGKILDHLRAIFVALPGHAAPFFAAVAHRIHHQALHGGHEGRGDSVLVHHVD